MNSGLRRIARLAAPIRIVLFLVLLAIVWVPLAVPIYVVGDRYDPNLASIIALVLLYVEFLILLWQWRHHLYRDTRPLKSCGLTWQRQDGLVLGWGFAIGLLGILILFGLELGMGWAVLQPLPPNWLRWLVEGLLVAVAVGWAEELLFRGWLLTELEQDYSLAIALWSSSLIFALAHFIRPLEAVLKTWPQFFGLLLLGVVLGWAKRSQRFGSGRATRRQSSGSEHYQSSIGGRLSLPIGLHAGLVYGYYFVDVTDVIQHTEVVPAWITGIDHNPLSGILGLGLLGGIGWLVRRRINQADSFNI